MIYIENLNVFLSDFKLKSIDLTIEDGEFFVLLGPTGAEGAAGTGQAAGGAGGSDVLGSGAGGTGSGLVSAALKATSGAGSASTVLGCISAGQVLPSSASGPCRAGGGLRTAVGLRRTSLASGCIACHAIAPCSVGAGSAGHA